MFLDLIEIGNSKGIRIPKSIIEACGFKKTIHLEIKDGKLILEPKTVELKKVYRKDWDQAFKNSKNIANDDLSEDSFFETEWDKEEWTW